MSSKIINFVAVCLFSLCIAGNANAGLIIGALSGGVYLDSNGIEWQYVGSYDITEGLDIKSNGSINDISLVNGIDVAEDMFGQLTSGEYALSTLSESEILNPSTNPLGYSVNHQAWYDTFIDISGLDTLDALDLIAELEALGKSFGITSLAENLNPLEQNTDGTPSDNLYDELGDHTALVDDHGTTDSNITHVFKSVSTPVPEPSTLAIFSLALIGLASRRFKK